MLREIQVRIANSEYYFTLHAQDRMTVRHISVDELEEALLCDKAEIIEDYPEDARGPTCLVLGFTDKGRPCHVQCTHPPNLGIVTVYEPAEGDWIDWRRRR